MAAVSWQIGSGGNLDLAANKNVLVRTNSNSMKKKMSGDFVVVVVQCCFGRFGRTLASVFSLCAPQLLPPPVITLLGKKKPTAKWIFLLS